MSKNLKSEAGFESYYQSVYASRWKTLKEALLKEKAHGSFQNPYIQDFPELRESYVMDEASIMVAKALKVEPGQSVLDMCAAPGGKSLILAAAMKGEGELVLNDRSATRRGRLKKVIDEYLPDHIKEMIEVTSHDASKWGLYQKDHFDRVLLDAPCSSERHVLEKDHLLKEWSFKRTKRLSMNQFTMICSALMALKVGGEMIYSTCSISPLENDGVIEKLLKKKKESVQLCSLSFEEGEKTPFGWQFFPDLTGKGPMYVAKLRKIN